MKESFKKVAANVLIGMGLITSVYGTEGAIETAVREYVTQKEDFNQGKACVETIKANGVCAAEDYAKVARILDNEKKFGASVTSSMVGGTILLTAIQLFPAGLGRRKREEKKSDKKPGGPAQ